MRVRGSFDTTPIDAMVRRSNRSGQPLVFVFHTWRGTFEQLDASLADGALRLFDGAHEILEDVAIAALQKSGN